MDGATRIVIALGQDTNATFLAAVYARQFDLALPSLADELEHPRQAILRMTGRPLKGSALVAASAIGHGQLKRDQNDLPEAERCFRWAGDHFHTLGMREGASLALTLVGRLAQVQERLEEAERCYARALALDSAIGNRHDEGVDLGLLAQVAWLRGNLDDAEQLSYQALALHRLERDRHSAAATLTTLAEIARERGRRWHAQLFIVRAKVADLGLL